jgi:hypothetical protein
VEVSGVPRLAYREDIYQGEGIQRMQVDIDVALRLLERLGLPLALVYAFIRGWIVPAYVYTQLLNSENEFRKIALRNAELTDRAVRATEIVVAQTGKQ